MANAQESLQQRISQFTARLAPMNQRAHATACGPCFMIFEELPPNTRADHANAGDDADEVAIQAVLDAFRELELLPIPQSVLQLKLPETGWRVQPAPTRFIQFSFERDDFQLDIPLNALTQAEAEQILRQREGFFYLRNRPEHTLHGEDVEGHDPFRKVYRYESEAEAAADMAFILFRVWRMPVDAPLYVSAAAFGKEIRWEQGEQVS